jgi:hypothetical protein
VRERRGRRVEGRKEGGGRRRREEGEEGGGEEVWDMGRERSPRMS